jgi:hypothetical protein
VTSYRNTMSTPPVSEKVTGRVRGRRLLRRIPVRVAWLTADVVAIVACAVLLVRGF